MSDGFCFGIIGYGLIGGSFGIAVKRRTKNKVIAFDKNLETVRYVLENDLADDASDIDFTKLGKCDIVCVALYPETTVEVINEVAPHLKKGAIIVDLCGIKEYISEGINIPDGIRFLSIHTMAGRETSGITSAAETLFDNASFIMSSDENTDPEAYNLLKKIGLEAGFGRIIETDPKTHDRIISYTSQLPHIMSVAYILQQAHKDCFGYFAGSFWDMTRVAQINPTLWSQLFKHNKEPLTAQIDEYISVLQNIKTAINSDDKSLEKILEASRELKEWQNENYRY